MDYYFIFVYKKKNILRLITQLYIFRIQIMKFTGFKNYD
jgi:hypothetical protein